MCTTILLQEEKVYMYVYSMKENNVFILLHEGKECIYTTP